MNDLPITRSSKSALAVCYTSPRYTKRILYT